MWPVHGCLQFVLPFPHFAGLIRRYSRARKMCSLPVFGLERAFVSGDTIYFVPSFTFSFSITALKICFQPFSFPTGKEVEVSFIGCTAFLPS